MYKERYAGFSMRISGFILDLLIIGIFSFIILRPIFIVIEVYPLVGIFIELVLLWLYFVPFLYSKWQATLGYKLLSLKIYNTSMNTLSFKQSNKRFFLSLLSLLLPFLNIVFFFSKKKQSFHDRYAGTLVIDYTDESLYQGHSDITFLTPMGYPRWIAVLESMLLVIIFIGLIYYYYYNYDFYKGLVLQLLI